MGFNLILQKLIFIQNTLKFENKKWWRGLTYVLSVVAECSQCTPQVITGPIAPWRQLEVRCWCYLSWCSRLTIDRLPGNLWHKQSSRAFCWRSQELLQVYFHLSSCSSISSPLSASRVENALLHNQFNSFLFLPLLFRLNNAVALIFHSGCGLLLTSF